MLNESDIQVYYDLFEIGKRTLPGEDEPNFESQLSWRINAGIGPCFFTINNFTKGDFSFVSENCSQISGYEQDEFYQGGAAFFINLVLPEHEVSMRKQAVVGWQFIHQLPRDQMLNSSMCYDYIMVSKNGEPIRILNHQIIIKLDEHNKIGKCLGVYYDISHIKTPAKFDPPISYLFVPSTKKQFFYNPVSERMIDMSVFTRREKEILNGYKAGKTSIEIAKDLFISTYTVQTYRANLYKKSGCRNMAQLISFAKNCF